MASAEAKANILDDIAVAMDIEKPSVLDGIDQIVDTVSIPKLSAIPAARRSIVLAAAIRQMRKLMTKELVEQCFMPLMNTRLGFRCDRPNKQSDREWERVPYDWETVRDALIEGFLRGARAVGNEINIIAGNCYLTLEYFRRAVREVPGITDVRILPGVPTYSTTEAGKAVVPFSVTWLRNGEEERYDRLAKQGEYDNRIPVRVFRGQTDDAALGKAERKALRGAFDQMTNCALSIDDDAFEGELHGATATTKPAAARLSDAAARARQESAGNGIGNGDTAKPADATGMTEAEKAAVREAEAKETPSKADEWEDNRKAGESGELIPGATEQPGREPLAAKTTRVAR